MSRRAVVWLVTIGLALVGSQLAHALAYRLVSPDAGERAHELAATGHGYLAYVPLGLALCTVLVAAGLAGELRHLLSDRDRPHGRPSLLGFAVVAPAIFVCQEHFERLAHDGALPLDAFAEPSILLGLLLQLPFALLAYLLARLLLGAVRSLGDALVAARRRPMLACSATRPSPASLSPRLAALACGYGSRGPPAPSR